MFVIEKIVFQGMTYRRVTIDLSVFSIITSIALREKCICREELKEKYTLLMLLTN